MSSITAIAHPQQIATLYIDYEFENRFRSVTSTTPASRRSLSIGRTAAAWASRWTTQQGGFWDLQKGSARDVAGDHKADRVNVFNDSGLASLAIHRQP